MTDYLSRLIAHMAWADRIIADALEAHPSPDAESVRLFAHIASVEHLWYSRILGRTPNHPVWPQLSPSESRALAAEHADLFARLVRADDAESLTRAIGYRNSAGRSYENSVTDIIIH